MSTLDNVSAATKLRREQMDVQAELDQKRSEFRERMDRVKEREQQLAKRRQDLQDKLVRFYKFIQENEIKKNRAEKKAQAEQRAKEEKYLLIVQLNEDSKRLEREKQEIKDRLQRYQKYQKYLDDVLQQNEEYSDPNDIISRWKTLDGNHTELQARKEYLEQQMEIQRQVLQKKKESKATEILDYTNALANKGKQLETLHREVTKAQDDIEYSLEKKTSTTKTIGQIKMATQNLYDRCFDNASKFRPIRKHGSKEEQNGEEILHQLQFIGECLGDYIYIREKNKEDMKAKKVLTQQTARPAGASPTPAKSQRRAGH
eukprot:TRINITY_DN27463_c0_g1_i1.p1 TRINITY_DN27463_c0_g1~~TRINITY_DN27463_c0_g1_i1.p1  ORF type:complete len:316 (+),score=87.04 TRINITY_DN27463_c0_g1_i1:55-1002(+)